MRHDDKINIEYVPTQILGEYFRYVLPDIGMGSIDGILYPSSQNEGKCCVLFMDNDMCKEHMELKSFDTIDFKTYKYE
jgi:hypothetical protein